MRQDPVPLLPAESIEKLLLCAEESGVARERLLAAAGLDPAGAPRDLPFAELARAYEEAARLTGDADFGLHVGERTAARMYGLLGYVVANARTLEEAVAALPEFQALWSQAVGFALRREPAGLRLLYWQSPPLPARRRRQENEQMLAALIIFIRGAVGASATPREVWFEHPQPALLSEHRRLFRCRLRFRAPATGILLPPELLRMPLPEADPVLAGLMRRQAETELRQGLSRQPFVRRCEALARTAVLNGDDPSLQALAGAMGVGPRTLQRRLREHDLSRRALIEAARMALAERLLEDPALPLAAIAFRLGYSQPSAFHRAFRRALGCTPRQYRRARVAAEP